MKNIKVLLLATMTMLFLGMGNVNAQEKESQTVILNISGVQSLSAGMELGIIVIAPDGSDYEIPLKTRTLKNRKEAIIANSKTIQSEINKWKQEGFKIDVFMTHDYSEYIIMSKD